jgi:hypothetical protein
MKSDSTASPIHCAQVLSINVKRPCSCSFVPSSNMTWSTEAASDSTGILCFSCRAVGLATWDDFKRFIQGAMVHYPASFLYLRLVRILLSKQMNDMAVLENIILVETD